MKRAIKVWDYAGTILEQTGKGALLTTKAEGKVNTMTIGWGTLGIEWGTPICTVFVRESRYTKEMLDKNPEFTVNVPYGACDKQILSLCGTRSGRDLDKIAALGLTLEEPEKISVPGIRELPLTLECRVVYVQPQDLSVLEKPLCDRYYPQDVDSSNPGSNRDAHIAFYGEIVASYIIE